MDERKLNMAEPLLEENDAYETVRHVRKRSRWQLFRSWFGSFALGVLCTLAVVGLLTLWSNATARRSYRFSRTEAFPSEVPDETVIFDSDPIFSQRPNDDTDYAWDMLIPPGRGYVFVDDAEERGLAPGEMTKYGPIYSVAMYHQIHCLARLRKMIYMFQDGVSSGELSFARQFVGREASSHVSHCLDYLRQSILCSGDMTLESSKMDGPSTHAKVDGWGVPHKCKSPSAIADFMDRFHFNESLSIDAAG